MKKSKDRKQIKKRKAAWCKMYGRTAKQIKKYIKKHGKDKLVPPPS
tara:strand:- start:3520 stop:3657 length:138 start_codon:yes stop_codon:yes gene_type:complete